MLNPKCQKLKFSFKVIGNYRINFANVKTLLLQPPMIYHSRLFMVSGRNTLKSLKKYETRIVLILQSSIF